METSMLIRVGAAVLAVVILSVIISRRKKTV